MKRFVAVTIIVLAVAVEARQIDRHLLQDHGVADLAESTLYRVEHQGEVIIELDAEPLPGRGSKAGGAGSYLQTLFDRLEKDMRAIELDLSRVAPRSEAPRSVIHHRYSRAFAGVSATIDPEAIGRIEALSYVRAVHPDRSVRAFLHQSVAQVGASEVWTSHGNRGAGVVVAVIDSGIDYSHPALGGGIGPEYKVIGGRDFVNGDDDPMDDAGHGTHVAGIVAANGGGLLGVAPEASLLAFKVLDETGSGRDSWVLAAIEAAIAEGADVVNMSLGRPAFPDDPVIKAVERGFAEGIVFCVAAGNSGRFFDIGSPGRAPTAITVGAIDRNGKLASFSSKGPVAPAASIKPEIAAPGFGILSSVPGGGFEAYSGTSMASPHAAGVVALVRSIHPEWSARRVRTAVINGAGAIDEEVMAAGAGALYAPDAVVADLVSSPSELSFGLAPAGEGPMKKSIYLTNRSDEARRVNLEIEGGRDGIELRSVESEVEIAPGEARRIDLELSFDHDVVEAPLQGSLSFGGVIRVVGSSGQVSVPWSVTKASKLRVRWTGPEDAVVKLGTTSMMTQGWLTGDGSATDMIIGAGPATVWLHAGQFSSVTHHVFVEGLDLGVTPELILGPDDAPHRVTFMARDIEGRLLSDRESLSIAEIVFLHPSLPSPLLESITFVMHDQEIFASTVSEALQLRAFERAFDVDQQTSWTVSYPAVRGIGGDVDLTFDPTEWIELPLRIPLTGLSNPSRTILSSTWLSRGNETLGSIAGPRADPDQPSLSEAWAWLAPSQEDAGAGTIVEISDQAEGSVIWAEFSAIEEGIIPGRRHTPRLSDRISPSGEPVTIGQGPGFPSAFIGSIDGRLTASMMWSGPNKERRDYDSRRTRGTVSDASGTVIASSGPSPGAAQFVMSAELPEPGLYEFQGTTQSFDLAGTLVEATLTSTFDTTKDDSIPPLLTSFRFADGSGRTGTRFTRSSSPILNFSTVDFSRFGWGGPAAGRTRVEYRRHVSGGAGQQPWIQLTAVEVGDDLDSHQFMGSPDGVLYRVDLSEAAAIESGAVDLRIAVEDPTGNTMVYTLEPAFLISSGRRRGVTRP